MNCPGDIVLLCSNSKLTILPGPALSHEDVVARTPPNAPSPALVLAVIFQPDGQRWHLVMPFGGGSSGWLPSVYIYTTAWKHNESGRCRK